MKKSIFVYLVLIVLLIVGLVWLAKRPKGPGPLDTFAACIKDSGATFYGAFWCPHCAAQKKEFGSSASLLPYVECSNPDAQSQDQVCNDAKIEGYPTWQFPNSFSLKSDTAPYKCTSADQSDICKVSFVPDIDVWVVGATAVQTTVAPIQKGTGEWTIAPGARLSGEQPLDTLATATGCVLPAGY